MRVIFAVEQADRRFLQGSPCAGGIEVITRAIEVPPRDFDGLDTDGPTHRSPEEPDFDGTVQGLRCHLPPPKTNTGNSTRVDIAVDRTDNDATRIADRP